MRVSSTQNPIVRYVRSLAKAPVRRDEQVYLAEGVRLVSEAVQTRQAASLVLYNPELLMLSAAGSSLLAEISAWASRAVEVDQRVLSAASQTETPAGVLAVLRVPEWPPLASHAGDRFGLLLDGLTDPGNAGTIVRTAAAFGVDYLVGIGGVDLFAPKVVRAGMGAHFRLPIYSHLSWPEARAALPTPTMVAADAKAGEPAETFRWPSCTGLVVGSEASGLSAVAGEAIQSRVHIPLRPGVQSLNAAVAASILLYIGLGSRIPEGNKRYR